MPVAAAKPPRQRPHASASGRQALNREPEFVLVEAREAEAKGADGPTAERVLAAGVDGDAALEGPRGPGVGVVAGARPSPQRHAAARRIDLEHPGQLALERVEERHVDRARKLYPHLRFEHLRAEDVNLLGETFDYIIVSQVLSEVYDVVALLAGTLSLCHDRTRLIVVNYSRLWQPALRLAEWLGIKPHPPPQNWLPVKWQMKIRGSWP